MIVSVKPVTKPDIVYPDSDGELMADNTKQFHLIMKIQGGLDALFKDDENVFVAGDLLWYPVEGDDKIRQAPDVMVVFGRPKGDRGSYRQWEEDNIAPQVVFEIFSPGNRMGKMFKKLKFYERYGVEEYYLYNPQNNDLTGWLRSDGELNDIESMTGWVSPHLGVRFEISSGELEIYRPDGERFLSYVELERQREQEKQSKESTQQRAEKLAAKLREMGINPDDI